MRRLFVGVLGLALSAGCAARLQAAAADHQAKAVALESAGDGAAALSEREAADDAHDRLLLQTTRTREDLPALSVF